ncbi:hypothetical protein ['Camptotheca acuminata' phytoplasma]|uniref:hypothetical protein n=1 Tax='Camptotheca acuminata' phytoplasma TaxID=3239192 RepID=UPI00351A05E7
MKVVKIHLKEIIKKRVRQSGPIVVPNVFQYWASIVNLLNHRLKKLNPLSQNLQIINQEDLTKSEISEAAFFQEKLISSNITEMIIDYVVKYVSKSSLGTKNFYYRHLFQFSRNCKNPETTKQIGLYPFDFFEIEKKYPFLSRFTYTRIEKNNPILRGFKNSFQLMNQNNNLNTSYISAEFSKHKTKRNKKALYIVDLFLKSCKDFFLRNNIKLISFDEKKERKDTLNIFSFFTHSFEKFYLSYRDNLLSFFQNDSQDFFIKN